jgi:hypothetical protein
MRVHQRRRQSVFNALKAVQAGIHPFSETLAKCLPDNPLEYSPQKAQPQHEQHMGIPAGHRICDLKPFLFGTCTGIKT